jgi:protein TonB
MAQSCPPPYPRAALRDHVQGRVVLRVRVSAEGRATGAEVAVSSGSELLDRAALAALANCRFSPAVQDGRPVPFQYEVPYRFRIAD